MVRRQFLKTSVAGAAGAALAVGADRVLGMIFPPANYPVPPEAKLMYPKGIRFLAEGVGLERITPAGYDKVVGKIVPAAVHLAQQGAQAISVMGTSLTFYKGAGFNEELKAEVTKATRLPSTTMSTAILEGLRTVGARRVAVATAYNEVVNRRLRVFLQESGFEVLTVKGLGIERFEDAPLGALGCISFFPSKNLGGFGDSGMVLTNDPELARKAASLRLHGTPRKYHHEFVGINSRLDTLQAAVLKVKFKHLDSWTEGRQKNAAF
jgi:hypothetical protein